jgi:hypothetical protein
LAQASLFHKASRPESVHEIIFPKSRPRLCTSNIRRSIPWASEPPVLRCEPVFVGPSAAETTELVD